MEERRDEPDVGLFETNTNQYYQGKTVASFEAIDGAQEAPALPKKCGKPELVLMTLNPSMIKYPLLKRRNCGGKPVANGGTGRGSYSYSFYFKRYR